MRASCFSKSVILALGIAGLIGWGQASHADPVSLSTTYGNSQFGAAVYGDLQDAVQPAIDTPEQDIPVTSLPYSGTANASVNGDTSTTTANLSTSSFNFGFNQSITDFDTQIGGSTDGYGDMYFVANTATSYSITGTLQFTIDAEQGVDVPPQAELYTYLYDDTTDTVLYSYDNTTTDGALGLSDQDALVYGSATGTLTQGDQYEYYVDENIGVPDTDPSLIGSGSITFGAQVTPPVGSSTPLPTALPAGLLTMVVAGTYAVRRSRVIA